MNYRPTPIAFYSSHVPRSPGEFARDGAIARLENEIVRCEGLATSIEQFVFALTNDRSVSESFHSSFSEWMTGDTRDQIAAMKAQPLPKYATPERMIDLTERRDKLAEQIGLMDKTLENLRGMGSDNDNPSPFSAMIPALELQLGPFRDQLSMVEQELSAVQAELDAESNSAAQSSAAQTQEGGA